MRARATTGTRAAIYESLGEILPKATEVNIEEGPFWVVIYLHERWWRRWLWLPAYLHRKAAEGVLPYIMACHVSWSVETVPMNFSPKPTQENPNDASAR